jgi:hypothetical protein
MHIIEKALLDAYDGWTQLSNGERNRLIRCPECGDSEKLDHGHLSITRSYPFLYKCFRCNWSGAVNADFLKTFGVEITPELEEALKENRASVRATAGEHAANHARNIQNIVRGLSSQMTVPKILDSDRSSEKIEYVLRRFNADFTNEELGKFGVIPDLRRFWKVNRIATLPRKKEELSVIADDYVAFSDSGCNGLICRNIREEELLGRYQEVRFRKGKERLYCFKERLDLKETKLKLILAEGIFDLIGIWNKFPRVREGCILAACLGKSPSKVIDFFTDLGFLDQSITIFADNDVEDARILRDIRELEYPEILGYKVTIARNSIGHDFGVPADQIKLITKRVNQRFR